MLAFLRTTLLPSAVLVAAAVLALAGDAPPGVSWLAGTPVAGHATELRLASGPRGHAVMAWTANGPRGTAIIAALRAPARPFGAPVVLGTGRVSRPRVAIGWNGDAVAVWRRRTRGATVLEAALRDAGGGFARAVRLDGGTVDDVAVAIDGARRVLVAWTERGRSGERRLLLASSPDRRHFDRPVDAGRARGLRLLGVRPAASGAVLLVRRNGRVAVETGARGGGARPAFLLPAAAADAALATDGGQVAAVTWTLHGVVQATTGRLGGSWRPALTLGRGRAPRVAVRPDRTVMVTSGDTSGLRAVTVSGPDPRVRQIGYPFGACQASPAAVDADREGAFHVLAACRVAGAAQALAATTRMPRGEWAPTAVLARDRVATARLAATSDDAAIAAWRQRGEVRVAFRNVASASGALMLFP